jgi:hypothetical protein
MTSKLRITKAPLIPDDPTDRFKELEDEVNGKDETESLTTNDTETTSKQSSSQLMEKIEENLPRVLKLLEVSPLFPMTI